MVFLDAATGLRRSELFALKWGEVEFENLQIIVQRSIYRNVVGNCKTEASKKPVPMDPILAADFGPGNNTALTLNPTIGCSRARVPRAKSLIGQISFFLASCGLP
jgi:integrase